MMKCSITMKSPCSLAGVITFCLLCLVTVESLDCYQCTNSNEDSCTATTTTCSSGHVCSNKVLKSYTMMTMFDKGCMLKSNCNSLEDLNTDRYCSNTPSSCMYCCGSDLCNGADSNLVSKSSHYLMMWGFVALCSFSFSIRTLW